MFHVYVQTEINFGNNVSGWKLEEQTKEQKLTKTSIKCCTLKEKNSGNRPIVRPLRVNNHPVLIQALNNIPHTEQQKYSHNTVKIFTEELFYLLSFFPLTFSWIS